LKKFESLFSTRLVFIRLFFNAYLIGEQNFRKNAGKLQTKRCINKKSMRVSMVPFFPKEALKNTSTAIQNLILV